MQDYAVDLVIRPGNMEPLDTFVAHNPAFSRELCVCVCVCVCVWVCVCVCGYVAVWLCALRVYLDLAKV